jgi:hypothetical protein
MRNLISVTPDGVEALFDPFQPWHMDLELILIVLVAVALARWRPERFGLHGFTPVFRLLMAAIVTWMAYVAAYLAVTRLV